MKLQIKFWIATTMLTTLPWAQAEIYKSVDKDGNVIFTDRPEGAKAEQIKLPEVNTQPATPTKIKPLKAAPETLEEEGPTEYSLAMTAPANETTVTMGQVSLSASVNVTPGLEEGHRVQFYMDNIPVGKPSTKTSMTYKELYRGIHQLHASVVDGKNRVLQSSAPVTIYVHRRSIIKSN